VPATVTAQSPLSISVSPLLGLGRPQGTIGLLSDSSAVLADLTWYLGAALEASYGNLPLRLRMGATQTIGGRLRTATGTESCGTNCSRIVYSPVGGAAMTTLWGDVVLAPASWWRTVAPYGFVGGALRLARYSPDRGVEAGFGRHDGASLLRYGLGVDLRLLGETELWAEWARLERNGERSPGVYAAGSDTQLTAGLRLSIF